MDALAGEHYRAGYNPEFYARAQARHKREAAERKRQEARERAERAEREFLAKQREKERLAAADRLKRIHRREMPQVKGRPWAVDIAEKVCRAQGVPLALVTGASRTKPVVAARHAAIRAVADARPDLSLTQIGRVFGRDHTTIVHSLRRTRKEGQVR